MTIQILKRRSLEAGASALMTLSGQYRLIVRRADGSVRLDTGFFDNLILDAGLNRIGTDYAAGRCEVGTGTAAPATNQTSLAAFAVATTTQVSRVSSTAASAPYYVQDDYTYRFALGALNGNYTEVGIGWSAGALFSRALFVDAGGTPTSVTVLSSEQLDVVYRIRMYNPASDWGGTYTIGGVSTTVLARTANATQTAWSFLGGVLSGNVSPILSDATAVVGYTGTLGAVTGEPSGTGANANANPVNAGYSNNSYTRASTITFGLAYGNIGGIRSVRATSQGLVSTQWQFTPAIDKDNTKTLALTLSATWARRP